MLTLLPVTQGQEQNKCIEFRVCTCFLHLPVPDSGIIYAVSCVWLMSIYWAGSITKQSGLVLAQSVELHNYFISLAVVGIGYDPGEKAIMMMDYSTAQKLMCVALDSKRNRKLHKTV